MISMQFEDFNTVELNRKGLFLKFGSDTKTAEVEIESEGYDQEETALNMLDALMNELYQYYRQVKRLSVEDAVDRLKQEIEQGLKDNVL